MDTFLPGFWPNQTCWVVVVAERKLIVTHYGQISNSGVPAPARKHLKRYGLSKKISTFNYWRMHMKYMQLHIARRYAECRGQSSAPTLAHLLATHSNATSFSFADN